MYLTKVYQEPFHYLDFVFKTVRFVTIVFALSVKELLDEVPPALRRKQNRFQSQAFKN